MAGVFPTSATSMAAPSARDQNNASPSPGLSFEVATIKPVDPSYHFDGTRFWAHVNPGGAAYWYMSPITLVAYVYDVDSFQVVGPEWAKTEHFDIEGRFPEGADQKDDRKMLLALLKDRMKLAFHIEKRELEGYALVVGKHGEKLRPSPPDPVSPNAESPLKSGDNNAGEVSAKPKATRNPDGSSTIDMGKRGTQTVKFDQEKWVAHWERSKMTMAELAQILTPCLGSGEQKVADETGLTGMYQVAWDCPLAVRRQSSAGTDASAAPSDPQDASTLFRSLEAMGLKLEKRKTLQDVYVIDHVEKPSAN